MLSENRIADIPCVLGGAKISAFDITQNKHRPSTDYLPETKLTHTPTENIDSFLGIQGEMVRAMISLLVEVIHHSKMDVPDANDVIDRVMLHVPEDQPDYKTTLMKVIIAAKILTHRITNNVEKLQSADDVSQAITTATINKAKGN